MYVTSGPEHSIVSMKSFDFAFLPVKVTLCFLVNVLHQPWTQRIMTKSQFTMDMGKSHGQEMFDVLSL